jgi:hypothetical protein
MKVDGSQNMIFCVINVINLSKDANNPPPSPYVDISDIQLEYERLLPTLPDSNQDSALGMSIKTSIPSNRLVIALERLENNSLLKLKNVSADFVSDIRQDIDYIRSGKANLRLTVENLIRKMTNFNSITAIGTLEFTDTMAKYAINRVTCNTRKQKPSLALPPPPPAPLVIEEDEKSQPPSQPSTPKKPFVRGRSPAADRGVSEPSAPTEKKTRETADQRAIREAQELAARQPTTGRLPTGVVRKSAQGK